MRREVPNRQADDRAVPRLSSANGSIRRRRVVMRSQRRDVVRVLRTCRHDGPALRLLCTPALLFQAGNDGSIARLDWKARRIEDCLAAEHRERIDITKLSLGQVLR